MSKPSRAASATTSGHKTADNLKHDREHDYSPSNSDSGQEYSEKVPLIHIEDASPSIYTFQEASTRKGVKSAYRPPSPSKFKGKPSIPKPLVTSQPRLSSLLSVLLGMLLLAVGYVYFFGSVNAMGPVAGFGNNVYRPNPWDSGCPDYGSYSKTQHGPYSNGPLKLPFQRPTQECRTFISPAVEKVISDMNNKLVDKDLARLFENCYPSTLDTTVRWHIDSTQGDISGPQSFIITGDINAEWLRDSTNQLAGYQRLVKKDKNLRTLILGAIATQADMVNAFPYCNAFEPPEGSNVPPANNGQKDNVHPIPEPTVVFECKYEIDSLANFVSLANQYYTNAGDSSFINQKWLDAMDQVFNVIDQQMVSTFDEDGSLNDLIYTFQRQTDTGTETLNLGGRGNPLGYNASLIRSAFRPSDDATILQYFIPGNAYMSVELDRISPVLIRAGYRELGVKAQTYAKNIRDAINKYGIVNHPIYGKVYAYEVDGYGSQIMMDDANLPSLLSLPLLGFVQANDPIYQNTRKMVLSQNGNPYYIVGTEFQGVGGPHIGLKNAWPMSLLVQIMTSDDDKEILKLLDAVKTVSPLGLINESVNVRDVSRYTRSWFAWANSVFAQTILDLAKRKPHLIFKDSYAYEA